MKTNASSTASAWGIKWCISPCGVGTKITYGGSNLQLSMFKLHKRGPQSFFFFFDFMATKFTLVLLSKIKLKIIYSNSCILYYYNIISHNIYSNRGPDYQPLRYILTFKSNRSMISVERKHYKHDMHNILSCILSRHCI